MSNANKPAFPSDDLKIDGMFVGASTGLTAREYAAIHIAAGISANPDSAAMKADEVAVEAVNIADAILALLENER